MNIYYVSPNLSAEDRSIIILSVNYSFTKNAYPSEEDIDVLIKELSKATPNINHKDYPLLYALVDEFYKKLQNEGEKHNLVLRDRDVYSEIMENAKKLLGKLNLICEMYKLGNGSAAN